MYIYIYICSSFSSRVLEFQSNIRIPHQSKKQDQTWQDKPVRCAHTKHLPYKDLTFHKLKNTCIISFKGTPSKDTSWPESSLHNLHSLLEGLFSGQLAFLKLTVRSQVLVWKMFCMSTLIGSSFYVRTGWSFKQHVPCSILVLLTLGVVLCFLVWWGMETLTIWLGLQHKVVPDPFSVIVYSLHQLPRTNHSSLSNKQFLFQSPSGSKYN